MHYFVDQSESLGTKPMKSVPEARINGEYPVVFILSTGSEVVIESAGKSRIKVFYRSPWFKDTAYLSSQPVERVWKPGDVFPPNSRNESRINTIYVPESPGFSFSRYMFSGKPRRRRRFLSS